MLETHEFDRFKIDGSTIIGGEVVYASRIVNETGVFIETVRSDGNYYYTDILGNSVSQSSVCNEAG